MTLLRSPRSLLLASLACSLAGLLLGCASPRRLDGLRTASGASPTTVIASGDGVDANWKERLAQPYVYVEHKGDYRRLGDAMRRLFSSAQELGIEPDGPPFALYFDDPGRVPAEELRAKVCLPVADKPGRTGQLRYDLLPRAMVVYARVAGAYPDAARSVPALFKYLHELGWRQGGPVREVYLVNPQDVKGYEELVTEVQIPWIAGAR